MSKFLERVKSNVAEVDNDENAMEVVTAVLLVVLAVAFIAVLFIIVRNIIENADENTNSNIDDFNKWAKEYK